MVTNLKKYRLVEGRWRRCYSARDHRCDICRRGYSTPELLSLHQCSGGWVSGRRSQPNSASTTSSTSSDDSGSS